MVIKYYVIRHKETGRYIKGTPAYHGWFVDDPRLFPSIGRLRSFITSVLKLNKHRRENWPQLCDDVSTWVIDEMVLTATDTKQLHEIVTGKKLVELLSA
jgi:hypothetical protein